MSLDSLAITGIGLAVHVSLALVLMHVIQSEADIPYVFRTQPREQIAHIEEYARVNLAHVVTERLLDAIVFLVAAGLPVISQFGYEMHGAKV